MTVKGDRRVRRTQKALRDALTQLLMEKSLKEISVIELVEQADINRGTFYLHYRDIYDLYASIEEEIVREFFEIFRKHHRGGASMMPIIIEAFEYLGRNADICRFILGSEGSEFLDRLIETGKPQTASEWEQLFPGVSPADHELYYTFITSGCVGLIRRWFKAGLRESPKRMAEIARTLMEQACRPAVL